MDDYYRPPSRGYSNSDRKQVYYYLGKAVTSIANKMALVASYHLEISNVGGHR